MKIRNFFLLTLLFVICYNGCAQIILRLVEAEASATANVTGYVALVVAENMLTEPLAQLATEVTKKVPYYSPLSLYSTIFLVYVEIAEVLLKLQTLKVKNQISFFFNRKRQRISKRISVYENTLINLKFYASGIQPSNHGNSLKLVFEVLGELNRIKNQIYAIEKYLYTRNKLSLLII